MKAWTWLEREGLLAPRPRPGLHGDWMFITRRGRSIKNSTDLKSFINGNMLPKAPTFVQGAYDTAVFQAFKEVEVGVRTKGNFDAGRHWGSVNEKGI